MTSVISDGWFHSVKAAQRDLIKRCAGIARAAEIATTSSTQMGRYNNPTDPDLMPLNVVLALEADCGAALVTAVMASLNGRRLVEREADGASAGAVFARHAETVRKAGELMSAGAAAFADGKLTPAEMASIDRLAGEVEDVLALLRKAIGTGKAEGGQILQFGAE